MPLNMANIVAQTGLFLGPNARYTFSGTCIQQPLACKGEEALGHPTLSFVVSREEPSTTTGGGGAPERSDSVEHRCDKQLVTCYISTAYSYVSAFTLETWEQASILQTAAKEAVQITMTEPPILGYAECR